MTLVDLAGRVGITAQSLSNAENGRQRPSTSTIESISTVLGFPIEFFSAPDLEELSDVQLSFRARSKTSNKAKSAVRSAARIAVELKQWIDDRFVTPKSDLPSIDDHMSPELAAEHVRARWGFDTVQAVPNCIHLLEAHGVSVFSLPPEYKDVDAFSFWWRDRPFVLLSMLKTPERSRFDAAHELGHLILHRNDDYNRDWRIAEREANQFASAFLMPRTGVLRHFPRPVTTDRIIRHKRRWRVAAMALTYRLHELGELSDWTYRQTVIELGRLGYRLNEPVGINRESSQLLAKVFNALRAERKSFTTAAKDLYVDPDELRHLTFGLLVRSAGKSELADIPDETDKQQQPALRVVR